MATNTEPLNEAFQVTQDLLLGHKNWLLGVSPARQFVWDDLTPQERIKFIQSLENRDRYGEGSRWDLSDANFAGAQLRNLTFSGLRLNRAKFDRAELHDADFEGAELYGASFRGAVLVGATFEGVCMIGVALAGACLFGANLSYVTLFEDDLEQLQQAAQKKLEVEDDVDFSHATCTLGINVIRLDWQS